MFTKKTTRYQLFMKPIMNERNIKTIDVYIYLFLINSNIETAQKTCRNYDRLTVRLNDLVMKTQFI